ncbi:hypothetical protein UT300005_16970 [Clostridium sp. CTA-5]
MYVKNLENNRLCNTQLIYNILIIEIYCIINNIQSAINRLAIMLT